MVFGRSSRSTRPVEPVTLKILVAGGFGVGKTTLVGAVSEIRPLRTEERLTEAGRPVDDTGRSRGQDHHHGGHGLRADHAPRGPGAVPVRHARDRTASGSCGTNWPRAPWARSFSRTPGVWRTASRPSTTSSGASIPFTVAVNCFEGADRFPTETVAGRARPRPRGAGADVRRARPGVRQGCAGRRSSSTRWPERTASASPPTT